MAWYNTYSIKTENLYFGSNVWIMFRTETYSASPTSLIGGGTPATLKYENSDDTLFSPVRASSVTVNIIEYEDDSLKELFTRSKCTQLWVYNDGDVVWKGWVIAGDRRTLYNIGPKEISITAVDGLTFLKKTKLLETAGSAISSTGKYKIIQYLSECLVHTELGLGLCESIDIWASGQDKETERPLESLYIDTLAFKTGSDQYDYMTLYEVLENILSSLGARIYQKDGYWYVDRIRQLTDDTITYRVYLPAGEASLLTYDTDNVETLTKDITVADMSATMCVPVNMSLTRSDDDTYRVLTNKVDYNINRNLVKYWWGYSVKGLTTSYDVKEKTLLIETQPRLDPPTHCVEYNLGTWKVYRGNTVPYFKVELAGVSFGSFDVQVVLIDNEYPTLRNYIYYNDHWLAYSAYYGYVSLPSLRIDSYAKDEDGYYTLSEFRGELEIKSLRDLPDGSEEYSSGDYTVYLRILSPIVDDAHKNEARLTTPRAYIDLPSVVVEISECKKDSNDLEFTQDTYDGLKYEREQFLHSTPTFGFPTGRISDGSVVAGVQYQVENANLICPRLIYTLADGLYTAVYQFSRAGLTDLFTLEDLISGDWLYFYFNQRWCLEATILGEFDMGTLLEYKGRRYMINRTLIDIKRAYNEVHLLEVLSTIEALATESSGFILTEDNYLVAP